MYTGDQAVVEMVVYKGDVITAFDGGWVYRSPDGTNLGGGGNSWKVYSGREKVLSMFVVDNGNAVRTTFTNGVTYLSPDGENLGGGGNTVRLG